MCITIPLENSVLRDAKLLAWEGGINFSFTKEENIKGILNEKLFENLEFDSVSGLPSSKPPLS